MDNEKWERRADMEEKLGKYRDFNSVEELIANLHHVSIYSCPWCGLIFYPESAIDIHCL